MAKKLWYASKTLWVNVLSIISIVSAGMFGFQLSPEVLCGMLGTINMILRLVTKEEIVWK